MGRASPPKRVEPYPRKGAKVTRRIAIWHTADRPKWTFGARSARFLSRKGKDWPDFVDGSAPSAAQSTHQLDSAAPE